MSVPPADSATPDIKLGQLRTTADAAAWLRHHADGFFTAADAEPSPVQARALRRAGSTLEAYAAVVGAIGDPAAVGAELARHAADYRHPERDAVEPLPHDYRLACGHLAGILGTLAQQLTRAAGPKQHLHHPVQPSSNRHIGL
jgi:hypothetical protein